MKNQQGEICPWLLIKQSPVLPRFLGSISQYRVCEVLNDGNVLNWISNVFSCNDGRLYYSQFLTVS